MSEIGDSSNRQVFICHASEDREQAKLLCDHLENEGIGCWIAPRDAPAGDRYAPSILNAIDACDVFLIVFSVHTDTPHVANEIEEGTSQDKRILLVRTDSTNPRENKEIRLFVGSHQWFDASLDAFESYLPRIATDVHRLLRDVSENGSQRHDSVTRGRKLPATGARAAAAVIERTAISIGIEVGATKIRGCTINLGDLDVDSPRSAEYYEEVGHPANARTVLQQVTGMAGRILDEHCRDIRPAGIGIAAPGQVDLRAGTLKFGPNLFGARNVPFKTHLSHAFPGIPIRVDNEVRCATRCELHVGIGREFESFVCIFIGAGVGSGTVVDRSIYFGHNFCAGEVGHIKIAPTGPPCACGQIGCLETFVKAQAIVDRAEAKAIDWESRELETTLANPAQPLTPEIVAEAIASGDGAAQEVATEIAENLGLGIANYLNLLNPAAVVMGGGLMSGFFLYMIDEITDAVQRNALAEVANTPIVQSAHSDDGIAIGAALLFHPEDRWPF
jgi:predicted NBD/HSP70 family sugar kinase